MKAISCVDSRAPVRRISFAKNAIQTIDNEVANAENTTCRVIAVI